MISTKEVAKKLKIAPSTLELWLADGKIKSPTMLRIGGKLFRKWTKANIAEVKRYKAASYRMGRGRKPG